MNWDIPKGWSWKPLTESLTMVRVQAKPDDIHDDWLYLGLEHVQSSTGEYSGVLAGSAGIKSNKFQFQPGDVLYGKLRPNLRKCAVAEESGVCSTDLVPLRPTDPETAYFLALQLRSEPFTAMVMRMIGGANLPRVSIKDLFTLSLPAPRADEAARFYAMAKSLTVVRKKQRELKCAVAETDLAVTAAALGLSAQLPTLKAVHDS